MSTVEADVCVVGAGPAGALFAGLMAKAGVPVALVGPHNGVPHAPLQSLAPAARRLLVDEGVDLVGAWAEVPVEVRWPGTGAVPIGPTDHNDINDGGGAPGATSVIVDRVQFDAALRAWAALQGVRLVTAKVAPRPVACEGVVEVSAGATTVRARRVTNAAGAHSVFAAPRRATGPRLFGLRASAPTTAPIAGLWVEATPSGWIWAASTGDGMAAIMTTHHEPPPRSQAHSALVEQLAASAALGTVVDPTTIDGSAISPLDLTPSLADTQPGVLAIGDAAVTIDPIAGQGLAVALRSAAQAADWLVAGERPTHSPTDVAATHRQVAVRYYAAAADHLATPFWLARARTAADTSTSFERPTRI
ncbi:MAG: lycopene cyclase family protein [Actinomycetota bacterium]